jgi:hypothetical protein
MFIILSQSRCALLRGRKTVFDPLNASTLVIGAIDEKSILTTGGEPEYHVCIAKGE